ncbi:uncharacterized protein LOC113869043 isoform X4 [Abrus precatorius]|uniref:Uncharacterized protein LOC113869043 isoform X4 n=1 Tax=Abrus precatorius TaxID=3816 RepID=A0A8B8LX57_ABRPR|nr:uncharacterized protein LOC113869043 isoform X4 [Abrus precatorius]
MDTIQCTDMMVKFSISNARYTYIHDEKYPSKDVDIHHIVLKRSSAKYLFVYATTLLVLVCALYLYVLKEKSVSIVYYSLLFDMFLVKLFLLKPIKKESVVIMPAFGVQLETHYVSGKITRCFVPIDKILKPILLECVTPMTCYWTLSLIVREKSEMVLVFKVVIFHLTSFQFPRTLFTRCRIHIKYGNAIACFSKAKYVKNY